ncbi:serine/threonine-protein kinase [Nonomuraea fuscirosea]|uniref:serine/threonine-protein kinase n=1 Tax=Nonomuraea fuscirosea TaxID=1291556 RepID=UPI0033F6EEA9
MEVPGYTEIRELGHGGTGRVMLAVRDSDGLAVAVKHLSAPLRQDAGFVTRFRAEARLIKEIDSPHTARVLDYVESGGDAVIVMELVDGVTLRRLLADEGATGPEAALVVLKGALLGLAEAHRHGVVHRDFKPENVMITQDGDSKLVDFGVAARFGENAELAGTPPYMAPEQWDDAPAGAATDVYAAALVFYECLTGHRAFHGENVAALAYQHQHVPPPLEDVEEPLRPLLAHGLAKDPSARPESAEAFLARLEETAREAYGEEWERRGRAGLGILLLPLAALLPDARAAAGGAGSGGVEGDGGTATSLAQSTLSPAGKLAMTGGLVVATAAAVVSAFVILGDGPGPGTGSALPPATSAPPFTAAPTAPTASSAPESGAPEPTDPAASDPATPDFTPGRTSGPTPADPPSEAGPTTGGPVATPPPATRPTSRPTRTRTSRPTATREPTREPTRSSPPTRTRTTPPATPPVTPPPDDDPPGNGDEPPEPPATNPPGREPLISLSVSVSLGLPVLGGEGDGLVDADVGLGLGTSLLGFLVVPGSVLLGRQIVVRRTRKGRDTGKS